MRPRYKQPRLRSRPRVRKKAIASQHTEQLVQNEHSIVGYLSPPPRRDNNTAKPVINSLVVGCEKKRSKAIPLSSRFAILKGDSTTVIKLLTYPPFNIFCPYNWNAVDHQLSRCRHTTQSTRLRSDSRRPSAQQQLDPLHSPVAAARARRIAAQQELDTATAFLRRLGRTMRRSGNCRMWFGVMKRRTQSVRCVWRN